MASSLNSLKEYFHSRLSPSLQNGLNCILDSTPITLACLCVVLIPLAVGLLFSVVYILAFLYGIVCGDPFPSREFFLLFPGLAAVFANPSSLAKALLLYAFAGGILSLILQREHQLQFGHNLLRTLGRNWNIVSFLIIFSLLFATSGEVFFSYRTTYSALAGILPYSDASGHYSHYTKYFYDGVMGDWVLRRPMAAFMGATIHWLAGNDPVSALLIRCLLVSCAMWASLSVMNKSFGVWSAVACLALEYSYIIGRGNYLHTFLTEPLGFFWGCTAVALWLQALRDKSLFWNLAAYSVTLVGLLTRMGAMFLAPTFFLYVLWRWHHMYPGRGWWKKPLLGLCICAATIILLNGIFSSRGVGDSQQTGSNFSYSFAGLTLGTTWDGAKKLYANQLDRLQNEKQKSRFLYEQGLKNILHTPGVFLKRLAQGEGQFLKNINFFLFHNWYLVWLMAALFALRHKTVFSNTSIAFWAAAWGGILISIPFIYFDDSWRVNIFVYPFIACFFSLALSSKQPAGNTPDGDTASGTTWLALALSCVLLLLMTSVALFPRLHTSTAIHSIQKYTASLPTPPSHTVLVGANGMGVLVVPDDAVPPPTVPAMTWSTFKNRYQKFAPSVDKTLFSGGFPPPPFVILNQIPVIGSPGAWGCFITPPEIMTKKDVLLWEFEISGEIKDKATGIPWKIVTTAKPVLYK